MLQARPATATDADHLAPRLRETDLNEIQAATGEAPLVALERSLAISEPCYAIVDEHDEAVALFGVVPDANAPVDDAGIVWLVGSRDLLEHSFAFLRNCREWVRRLHQPYRLLWNCVDIRNEVHIRWLKWCGFTLHTLIEEYGVERRPFYEFAKVRNENKARKGAMDSSLEILDAPVPSAIEWGIGGRKDRKRGASTD